MYNAKHISTVTKYDKHDVYFGTINPIMSHRDYAFGYFENGGVGYITFIHKLR